MSYIFLCRLIYWDFQMKTYIKDRRHLKKTYTFPNHLLINLPNELSEISSAKELYNISGNKTSYFSIFGFGFFSTLSFVAWISQPAQWGSKWNGSRMERMKRWQRWLCLSSTKCVLWMIDKYIYIYISAG